MNLNVKIDNMAIEDNPTSKDSSFELSSGDVVAIVGPTVLVKVLYYMLLQVEMILSLKVLDH